MTLSRGEVDGSAFARSPTGWPTAPTRCTATRSPASNCANTRARRASPAARPRCYRPTPRRLPSAVGVDRIALLRSERRRKISLGNDSKDAPWSKQTNAFQRPSAVNWLVRPPAAHAMRDLLLLKPPERPILPHNRQESGECQIISNNRRGASHYLRSARCVVL